MKWLNYIDKTALVYETHHIHYRQLLHGISTVGKGLRGKYASASRIAIIGANSPEWILALYSIWQAGFTAVPIDCMATPEEIAYIFRDCQPAAVYADDSAETKIRAACEETAVPRVERLHLEQLRQYFTNTADFPLEYESPDDETALIIYTSGTTGNPKGVMLTFGNLQANILACSVQTKVFIPEDKVLVALPLHHIYPLMASLIMPMSIGATAVFATSLTGNAIMTALKDNQCTFIIGVPRLLEVFRNLMLRKITATCLGRFMLRISTFFGSLRLSRFIFRKVQDAFGGHIRYISSGGAAADPQVTKDFYAMGFHLLEGYGMTETAPMISFTPPNRHKPGSPGKPIPCNEICIQDGEVLVRGKNVMKGYYNRPEETAQIIDEDGWLHTGDLGYVDKDGFLFLTGRSKELIILGNGKNINPAELEQKLTERANGMFSECAVSDDGHHLVAILVPDMAALAARAVLNIRQTIMDEVIEPFNESVPSYKRITRLELSETPLPRTRLGKPRRHIIRQQLAQEMNHQSIAARRVSFQSPMEEKICHCLEEITGRTVHPNEHFELDLNLDSLGKIALFSTLSKKLEKDLDMNMLAKYPTGRLLAAALETAPCHKESSTQTRNASAVLREPAWTHGLMRLLFSGFIHCLSRVSIFGTENIPEGPCIFAPNHQSSLDSFFLATAWNRTRFRNTYFYATAKYFNGRFRKWFAERHNLITMEINGDLALSFSRLETALNQGKSIVIFPEGTRSMDGSISDFRPTFAHLAIKNAIPIVPVAINGAFDVLPRWKKWPKFGKHVTVNFLPPIIPTAAISEDALCRETKEKISVAQNLQQTDVYGSLSQVPKNQSR